MRYIRLAILMLGVLVAASSSVFTVRLVLLSHGHGQGVLYASESDLNAAVLRLAAVDISDAEILRDASTLLLSGRPQAWSRRGTKVFRDLPRLRDVVRLWSWSNGRTDVMSDLLGQIKRPIDLHFGRPEEGGGSGPYESCAVVGNSGILLKAEHGELIDSHEVVIRLNNARIHGYERQVGSRTNISFINSNILHQCTGRIGCACHPYGGSVPIVTYICQARHLLDYLSCNASHPSPLILTDHRLDALCARIVKYYSIKRFVEATGRSPHEWGTTHEELMFHYSSGMEAIMMAAGVCARVSVFGFGKSVGANHHYHTSQRTELDLHDYNAEYDFYRDLATSGKTIPFLDQHSTFKFKLPPVVFYH